MINPRQIRRSIMGDISEYVSVSSIVERMMKDGVEGTFMELYLGIVSDSQVVTICDRCHLVRTDDRTVGDVLRFVSSFSDSTAISTKGGRDYVSLLELFYEYRSDLHGLNILNQFELGIVLASAGIGVNGDMVDFTSLLEISKNYLPSLKDEDPECEDDDEDELMDIDDGDDPYELIREYVRLFGGREVSWDSISHHLYISENKLNSLKPGLSRDRHLILTDYGVSYSEHEVEDKDKDEDEEDEVVWAQPIPEGDIRFLVPYIWKIMADGRKRSTSLVQKMLLSDYRIDASLIQVLDCMISMVGCNSLVRLSPKTFRLFKSQFEPDVVRSILDMNHNCVYQFRKLFSKYEALWKKVGVFDSDELLMIIREYELAPILNEDLISFDGMTVEGMVASGKYSRDELKQEYGIRFRNNLSC